MPAAAQINSQKQVEEVQTSDYSGFAPAEPPTDASRRLAEISQDLFDSPISNRPSSGDAELDSLIDDLL